MLGEIARNQSVSLRVSGSRSRSSAAKSDLAEAGERLMKAAGIAGVSRRRTPHTTLRGERQRPSADLVDRDFTAEKPNQL